MAVLHTHTGEVSEHQLVHEGPAAEEFYATLSRPVTVGIESSGYAVCFHTLMPRLGHTRLVGDAATSHARIVRKTKPDRRDTLVDSEGPASVKAARSRFVARLPAMRRGAPSLPCAGVLRQVRW